MPGLRASAESGVNAQAREELRSLAEQQGALRRVATLVAQGAEPRAVFTTIAVEAARVLSVGAISFIKYDVGSQMFTKVFGTHGQRSAVPDGGQMTLDDCPEGALVVRTGRPARVDDWTHLPGPVAARHREQGFGQAIAAPIIVDGSVWGLISAFCEADEILPPECEARLAEFTQLMAIAIANVQAREELRSLAEQQGAALRRVATLVAQQAPPSTIFNAVAGEASRALGVSHVDVVRCAEDGSVVPVGSTGDHPFSGAGKDVAAKVMEARHTARIDRAAEDFRSAAGAPILVEGGLWGVIVVLSEEILPADTETRLTDFTHLVAGSISNVQARKRLIASRARIVTAADETRRRIERNLHDGIQQRVVALGLGLRAARMRFPLPPEVQAGLEQVSRGLEEVAEEIRVFSQGLHPALLSCSGLGPALRELARRSPIPVTVTIAEGTRFPEPIETAVYYVVSEALANAAKHSNASEVSVRMVTEPAKVRAIVTDDGVGGASLSHSSGLIGLVDRVEALGGRFTMDSPVRRGTTISIELPLVPPSTGWEDDGVAERPDLDTSRPNIARVYDYWLGGTDNFAADREEAERLLRIHPDLRRLAQENRLFLRRAVRWLAADRGIRQFLDIGSGLPTVSNTHEVAQAAAPDSKVAYVDKDPVVVLHADRLLADGHDVIAVRGDAADPAAILADPRVNALVAPDRPYAIILAAVLHFFPLAAARRIITEFASLAAPGSYLVISVGSSGGRLAREYAAGTLHDHSPDQIRTLLTGLEIIDPPGLVDVLHWAPATPAPAPAQSGGSLVMLAAVAQTPGGGRSETG
jgi:signal transduction histidine kinase